MSGIWEYIYIYVLITRKQEAWTNSFLCLGLGATRCGTDLRTTAHSRADFLDIAMPIREQQMKRRIFAAVRPLTTELALQRR